MSEGRRTPFLKRGPPPLDHLYIFRSLYIFILFGFWHIVPEGVPAADADLEGLVFFGVDLGVFEGIGVQDVELDCETAALVVGFQEGEHGVHAVFAFYRGIVEHYVESVAFPEFFGGGGEGGADEGGYAVFVHAHYRGGVFAGSSPAFLPSGEAGIRLPNSMYSGRSACAFCSSRRGSFWCLGSGGFLRDSGGEVVGELFAGSEFRGAGQGFGAEFFVGPVVFEDFAEIIDCGQFFVEDEVFYRGEGIDRGAETSG